MLIRFELKENDWMEWFCTGIGPRPEKIIKDLRPILKNPEHYKQTQYYREWVRRGKSGEGNKL